VRRFVLAFGIMLATLRVIGLAQGSGPYKIIRKDKVGADGRFDYVYADVAGRRLYIPRMQANPRVTVFNLDTLAPEGEIPNTGGHGVAVDPKSHHGFASSDPVAMWDTRTLKLIKTIEVQGGPDGIHLDPFNDRIWVFSHRPPNATVIDAKTGTVVGTVDLGGAPEEEVSNGKGTLYVDLEDKDKIAVVDAKTLKKTSEYDLAEKGGGPAGLAFDRKHHVLFATCHNPATMVILNSDTGKILETLPIGQGTDGAAFNPNTMEAFSSGGGGELTIIKENSPTSFSVEQNLETMRGAKTLTVDTKTNRVFLIAAEYGPLPTAPPAAPGAKGGRGGRGRFRFPPMVPGSFTILVAGR
jgi:DNA-binding beta-propeller fold protein YncE